MSKTECLHEDFECAVAVGRISDFEGGPVTHYAAEITIQCSQCKQQFSFLGVPHGSHPEKPMLSADGTELRAPIAPGARFPDDCKLIFTLPQGARSKRNGEVAQ